MNENFTLCVGDNSYVVSGVEASWYAFQCACSLADAVGGESVCLWGVDKNDCAVLVAIN